MPPAMPSRPRARLSAREQKTVARAFFSSRRRHTRSLRDWNSDVCSSDLDADAEPRPHRMSDQMGAGAVEIIDHGDDIAGPRLLTVAIGVRRLVAYPVAE